MVERTASAPAPAGHPDRTAPLGRILLIFVLLIVYGSLYPFRFHPLPGGVLSVMFSAWPDEFTRYVLRDTAVNLLLYLPIGVFGALWIGKDRLGARAAALTLLLGASLSASMEVLQAYDDSRSSSAMDLLLNIASTAIGILVVRVCGGAIRRLASRPALVAALRPSGALMLLSVWFASQTFPFFPVLSRTTVFAKMEGLWDAPFYPGPEAVAVVVDWLVVARLLESLVGTAYARRILPVALLLVPARLLILGRTVAWPEVVGPACAWILWSFWLWRSPRRTPWLAWSAPAMLVVRGLAPYSWNASPARFSLVPFAASLSYSFGVSVIAFLDKGYLYGSAVWLFRQAGAGYLRPAAALALLLGALEWAQLYLPGRTAEITDPLYLILLAVTLKWLDSARAPEA